MKSITTPTEQQQRSGRCKCTNTNTEKVYEVRPILIIKKNPLFSPWKRFVLLLSSPLYTAISGILLYVSCGHLGPDIVSQLGTIHIYQIQCEN